MAEVMTERQIHENFHRIAENFKRCLRDMGYEDVKAGYPLEVLENRELNTTFVIDHGEAVIPTTINIRMKAKGVWTYIYMPHPEMKREGKPAAERTERLYDETGELVACQECGCMDFVKKGEEYTCAICCQSNPG